MLESLAPGRRFNTIDTRFPVQLVVRPDQSFRGYAGTVASGSLRVGDEVLALPSGIGSRVRKIVTADGDQQEALVGDAVVVTLDSEIDVSRGDMLVRKKNAPTVADRFDAYVCWMNDTPLQPGRAYTLMHTTREVQAFVERVEYRVDIETMHREAAERLELNEIGRVGIVTARPLCFDSYRLNSATGSFVLIDPATNVTVGAGMIRGETNPLERDPAARDSDREWRGWNVPRSEREAAQGHQAAVVWLTGPTGAGKSTIARAVERRLFDQGYRTMLLDDDDLRQGLDGALGFSSGDRRENVRRAGALAKLLFEAGHVVVCALASPRRRDRDAVRALFPDGRFAEIHVTASAEILRQRAGEPGTEQAGPAGYEAPTGAQLIVDTGSTREAAAIAVVSAFVGSIAPR
jgi:bifunctional enzyme CysN/CysC